MDLKIVREISKPDFRNFQLIILKIKEDNFYEIKSENFGACFVDYRNIFRGDFIVGEQRADVSRLLDFLSGRTMPRRL